MVGLYGVTPVAWSPSLHHFLFAAWRPYQPGQGDQVEALFLVSAPEPGAIAALLAAVVSLATLRRSR